METIRAIYDSGVLRPLDRISLPDQTIIEFEPRVIPPVEDEDESWTAGVNEAWAKDWADPCEDIYTLDDGEPVDDLR